MKKAVVLLSGGLDSATVLSVAKQRGFSAHCLIFDYGQRHKKEVAQARSIARDRRCPYEVVKIHLPWRGSALLDRSMALPKNRQRIPQEIPVTYVPARNIIFLSFAASYAETIKAKAIFIGANVIDYSGYPDCRPAFFRSYQQALARGLKAGIEKKPIHIYTPLVRKTKVQIIRMGLKLKTPYHLTWSCYTGAVRPCGVCDSCLLRQKGFSRAGIKDPAL